ncbi:MAG TPA: fibronectin type III domain-containing protein, partial [Pseudonocardiaceae bacterium]
SGPFALFAVLCVAVLIAVLTGAARPLTKTEFALAGHWVFNSVLQNVFHIDGATTNIDAQLPVTASPGSQVVQGDTSGFVVSPNGITEFSKSTLSVQQTIAPPADEMPVSVEAAGGPYLVYRNAGKIDRLGDPPVIISAGSPVGDPLVTSDGTMWLHRTSAGLICTLPKGANAISGCPITVPKDHSGALTMIGDRVAFVDLFTGQIHTIDHNTLGPGVSLGVPVSPDSRPAPHDLAGRVVLLDPERHSLLLADTENRGTKPVTIALPGGDYAGPVSNGKSVVLVDRQSGTVLTFGPNGKPEDAKPIEHAGGQPRLSQGEDNHVYVENPSGTRVLIVADDGKVKDVPVTGKPVVPTPSPGSSTGQPTEPRTTDPTVRPTGTHEPVPPPTPARPPVALPASAPGAPGAVSATVGDTTATVTWGAAANNRSAITSYLVSWRGSFGQAGSMTVSGGASKVTVNGLTDGVGYTFTVTATNQVGTGPGVATAMVTPFAAGTAPNPTATYQNGTVTVNWTAPDLRGGTLLNYLVSATGQADRPVTATTTSYTGLAAGQTVTFTVRAVTRAPDGQTLTGAPGSASVTVPAPKITIVHGAPTTSSNCKAPDCANVNATITGFTPNTTYPITLSSDSNSNVATESFMTDANGNAEYDQLDYDSRGQTVWIVVNGVQSNQIVWP